MVNTILVIVCAYLIGSISFAVVVSKLYGLDDPRTYGSGNPGATNVLRTGNKVAAILTLLGDCFKGWLAVFLIKTYGIEMGVPLDAIAYVALAVFCGHVWPIFFRFVGGKGVATALGVLLGLNMWLGVATAVTWLVIAYAFRYSSLSALIAAVYAPFYSVLLFGVDNQFWAVLAMGIILIYRHKSNINNLLQGREGRLGEKKKRK